jgi:5-methylcytosine-specific restriction endonuclease McrA
MDNAIRAAVAARASYACEYCRLHEVDDCFAFHVEHIIARKHGGADDIDNLAFACQFCNLHKGTNLSGIDLDTAAIVELFHPRKDKWRDHFATEEYYFIGLTPKGRATVRVLAMNDAERVRLRSILDITAQ